MLYFLKFYLLIFRESEERREGVGGRERLIYCSAYLCIHWMFGVHALTRDWTYNLGLSRQGSNQLSYLARARQCCIDEGIDTE